MKYLVKEDYLAKAGTLPETEQERILSRMSGKLPKRLDKEKLTREEAIAIQMEIEDEQLDEWRQRMHELQQKAAAKAEKDARKEAKKEARPKKTEPRDGNSKNGVGKSASKKLAAKASAAPAIVVEKPTVKRATEVKPPHIAVSRTNSKDSGTAKAATGKPRGKTPETVS